jgi:cysteine desulfurase/selenocysteine lyase
MSEYTFGSRALFPDLEASIYLNHAAISPLSTPVRDAIRSTTDRIAAKGMAHYHESLEIRAALRSRVGQFLGTQATSVAFTSNTSQGITAVAMCLPWKARDRVLLFDGEFPANVTPWLEAARLFDLEPVWLSAHTAVHDEAKLLGQIEDELRRGVRLVAISAVQFQTGYAMPLGAIGALCRRHGAELFVDAIQAVGVMPLDVTALGIDYLSAGCHKWMMGLEGSGILTIAPERLASLEPRLASWLSHEEGLRFLFDGSGHLRYDRPFIREALVLEGGMQSMVHNAALDAALDALEGLGVESIYDHVNQWHDALEPHLAPLGLESVRASDASGRSGTLSCRLPQRVVIAELLESLSASGVAVSSPDGYLRFAPHWPNHLDEVPKVVDALRLALHP